MTRRRWVVLAVVVALAVAGTATWMVRVREREALPTPTAYVGASWQQYKDAPGHRRHVTELGLPCAACHAAEEGKFDHPAPTACARCHEQQAKIEHGLRDRSIAPSHADAGPPTGHAELSKCVDCHGFGPEPDRNPNDCVRCHNSPQGETHAIVAHLTVACNECHTVHENKIEPKACTSCHAMNLKHGHESADVAGQCRVCHEVHTNASSALEQCTTCHITTEQHGVPRTAVFAGGHTCGSCHAPHEFVSSRATACASCHRDVHPLMGHEQSGCTSCHDAHAVRDKLAGGAVCVTCHAKVELTHAEQTLTAAGTCLGCHAAHPAKTDQGPEACTSCHQDIGGPQHTAHATELACTSCHAPHGFRLEMQQTLCAKCHAEQVSALKKGKEHDECTSCHQDLPHGLGSQRMPCGACHGEIQSKVHKGHTECTKCHEPHQASVQQLSCEHCHKQEAQLHPRGHDNCVQCHEQHTGLSKPGVSDCTGCHKRSKLVGLHNEPKHLVNGCVQCHAAHGADAPGLRQMCVNCHDEQVTHQPEATRCDGCHAFIGSRASRGLP